LVVAGGVAGVGRVGMDVVRARLGVGLLLISGARLAGDTGTLLVQVALARGRTADERARLGRGCRAGRARAGAGLGWVAGVARPDVRKSAGVGGGVLRGGAGGGGGVG